MMVQPGVEMASALHVMFPKGSGSKMTWRPNRHPDVQIPLTVEDRAGYGDTRFDGVFGSIYFREVDSTTRL